MSHACCLSGVERNCTNFSNSAWTPAGQKMWPKQRLRIHHGPSFDLESFFWLKMNDETNQTEFSTLENAVSVFKPGCAGDHVPLPVKAQVPTLSNGSLRGHNNKGAYQRGEGEPQHRGTGEVVQGFTAVISDTQNVDSMLPSISPVPSLDPIYFSLDFLEEPLSPICFVNLLYFSLIFTPHFLQ